MCNELKGGVRGRSGEKRVVGCGVFNIIVSMNVKKKDVKKICCKKLKSSFIISRIHIVSVDIG